MTFPAHTEEKHMARAIEFCQPSRAPLCAREAPRSLANAEGEAPTIAPNTWVSIYGMNLAQAGDTRIWLGSDFVNGQLPTQLDGVSVTVNGKPAYVYYISPVQINILTPPDALTGPVNVVVTSNAASSAPYLAQTQPESPSFFVFNGGPYIAAVHANGSLIGPATLFPGASTPAQPGETIMIYANGFGFTIDAGGERVVIAIGIAFAAAGHQYWRHRCAGGVRRSCGAGRISVQRGCARLALPSKDQRKTATYNGRPTQALTVLASCSSNASEWTHPRLVVLLGCVMREDQVGSLGLIMAGEAAFHRRRLGGFAVYEGSEPPSAPVASYFAESFTINCIFVGEPGTKDWGWPKTLLFLRRDVTIVQSGNDSSVRERKLPLAVGLDRDRRCPKRRQYRSVCLLREKPR